MRCRLTLSLPLMELCNRDHCLASSNVYPSRKLVFCPEPFHDGQEKSIRAIPGQKKGGPTSARMGLKPVQHFVMSLITFFFSDKPHHFNKDEAALINLALVTYTGMAALTKPSVLVT